MLPKRYQKAFSELADQATGRFSQIVPATGGILSQRGQLKRLLVNEIDLARQRSRLLQTVVRTFTDSPPMQELHHVVSVGGWVRP
jgi:F0F1-type ATP synthase delta subunit